MIEAVAARFRAAPNLTGIVCVIGAVSAFTTQDMAIKWISSDYPLHQIIGTRAAVALCLTLGLFVPLEGGYRNLKSRQWPLHLLRGGMMVVANSCFFASLVTLSLAEATAIFFIAPVLITLFSILLLGERAGPHRWFGVLVGLAGVIIMVRPGGASFSAAVLLPLVAALGYSLMQILTRKLGMTEKASTLAFYIQMTFVVVSLVVGLIAGDGAYGDPADPHMYFLLRAWVWPSPGDFAVMLGVGLLSGVAGYMISQAYRIAHAAAVAPFEYIALPFSVFWSIAIWSDWPDAFAWTGIALIAGAGLYIFYRETRHAAAAKREV